MLCVLVLQHCGSASTALSMNKTVSFTEDIVQVLDLYACPVLVVVGSTCNTLVIIVMRMRYFRNVSTSFYISVNALVDNISLFLPFPAHWLYVNFPDIFRNHSSSDFLCKIFHFLGWFTSNFGIALTAAMTMDRAIAVKFPLKSLHLCTVKKARYVTLTLLVVIALKDIHYILKSRMVSEEVTAYMCEIKYETDSLKTYEEKVWPILQHGFLLVSFAILITNNFIILRGVRNGMPVSQPSLGSSVTDAVQARRSARSKQLTIMLLSDSLSVIICTLPLALFDIIRPQFEDPFLGHLIYAICFYLVYVNRCVNFFLYCLSGEKFREGLKRLVHFRCCMIWRNMNVPMLTEFRKGNRRMYTISDENVTVSTSTCQTS